MTTFSSRSFARRSVVVAAALMAGSAALLASACGGGKAPAGAGSPAPSVSTSIPASTESPPTADGAAPVSVPGLPGRLYYSDADRLVRLANSGPVTVSGVSAYTANVSPDGGSIAFVDQDSLVVTDRNGRNRRTVLAGVAGVGYEPVWSPDSRRLLVVRGTPGDSLTYGIVTVASGGFSPLAHQLPAIHVQWSADGKHLAYATGECRIGTADADGGNARLVPVFGDQDTTVNPQQRRSCDPYSVSADGRYVAVNQRTGDQPDGDIGRDIYANAVIDTRTGDNVSLPVTGQISAIWFLPNGEILVRTPGKLTLLSSGRAVRTQVTEPAAVKNMRLLAYVSN